MASEFDSEEMEENQDKERLLDSDVFTENTKQQKQESNLLAYLQCYFVTIAAILGTGILGLPVKLSNSGFMPFLVVFVLGFFAQALIIYYFVEILQKAFMIKQDQERNTSMLFKSEGIPLHELDEDKEDSSDENDRELEVKQQDGSQVTYHISDDIVSTAHYPSLHSLAELFLGPGLQQLFELAMILMFVSLLISYSLAGSQAYAQLGHFQLLYVIPVFTWVCTFIIVFLQSCVQPFVSILTFCKGTLFTACVLAAMYVGYFVNSEITEDIRSAGEPFLMGTVALGGVVNVMPMIFTKIKLRASQVSRFRQAIIAGTITCTILNILWCYAVLEVVPQKECTADSPVSIRSVLSSNATINIRNTQRSSCLSNGSLQWAEANGQISTIPLTEILQQKYTEFTWIAVLIQVFVMISITVSFLTMGAALRHMMDGWLDSFFTLPKKNWQHSESEKNRCSLSLKCVTKTMALLVVFGFVFMVAMFNPKGFVTVLENATSFIMNLESGIFVIIMLNRARSQKYRHLGVPVPLSKFLVYLQYPVVLYFLVAVGYDVVEVVHHSLHPQTLHVHREPPFRNSYNLSESVNTSGLLHHTHSRRWRIDSFINGTE